MNNKCPNCHSKNINAETEGVMWCDDCGATWDSDNPTGFFNPAPFKTAPNPISLLPNYSPVPDLDRDEQWEEDEELESVAD